MLGYYYSLGMMLVLDADDSSWKRLHPPYSLTKETDIQVNSSERQTTVTYVRHIKEEITLSIAEFQGHCDRIGEMCADSWV